jgi:glucose-fructose oxidoreductase
MAARRPTKLPRTPRHRARRAGASGGDPVRYAVVGLGYIAQVAVLPAFAHARRNSTLAALVSDDATKLRTLGRRYGVDRLVTYDDYDALLASGDVDAVYVALPNTQHRDFTVRAARAGVHVLCEKPMAMTSADCEAMIDAAERADVRLMVAYRLHFERANLEAVRIARSGKLGDLRFFGSHFAMQVQGGNIRLDAALGGGTLWDIGIYCLNAARSLFRAEPRQVFAAAACTNDPRFREVEEAVSAVLGFPDERLATFTCSFGAADVASYELVGTRGRLRVDPAYEFAGELKHVLTVGERTTTKSYPKRDQFAPELLHFSDCVRTGREPEPSGREGLADVRVIEALYRSIETGRPVALAPHESVRHPRPSQEVHRPAVDEPDLVHAAPPHRA